MALAAGLPSLAAAALFDSPEPATTARTSADRVAPRADGTDTPRGSAAGATDGRRTGARAGTTEQPRDANRDAKQAKRDAKKDPCAEADKACAEALALAHDDDLASIDLDIRVRGKAGNDYPCECRLEGQSFEPRRFASTTMTWKATGVCHKPLYFEDWNLERYGHSYGCLADPFVSAAHFFVTLPVLPYKAGVELPWECVYPLGYYRPGSCAPWTCPAPPISPRGFAVQAATVTGLVFLLP
ncbi:MAG: hypothetical protein FJ309_11610 [Planctomycetes bacterium]|nr:hypothetical protein [Planctomycetota bacterium]